MSLYLRISLNLFSTKTVNSFSVLIQCNTQRESIHSIFSEKAYFNLYLYNDMLQTPIRMANNSSLGREIFSLGARRVLENT